MHSMSSTRTDNTAATTATVKTDRTGIILSTNMDQNNILLSAIPEKSKFFMEAVPVHDFGPPVLVKEVITSHKQLRQRLRDFEAMNINHDQIILFFVGTPDKNGRSWHADSNSVERAVNYMLQKLKIGGFFLVIHVGTRDEWLNLDNMYKQDPKIKLVNIPTLWVWETSKRIFGKRCLDLESIYLLLKD